MSLISWQDFCNTTGTQTTDNVSSVVTNVLIPIASDAVEAYCDRFFEQEVYFEWQQSVNAFGLYYPKQYPVTKLYSVSTPDILCYISNNSNPLNIVITNSSFDIYNPITTDDNSYSFVTYNNVSSLINQINIDYPQLTFTYNPNYSNLTSLNTQLLAPDTKVISNSVNNQPIFAALNQMEAKMINSGITLTGIVYNTSTYVAAGLAFCV